MIRSLLPRWFALLLIVAATFAGEPAADAVAAARAAAVIKLPKFVVTDSRELPPPERCSSPFFRS